MKTYSLAILGFLLSVSVLPVTFAQDVFESFRSVNFQVRYQSGVTEEDARKVADYLESDYDFLRKKLKIDLGRTVEVRIYGSVSRYASALKRQKAFKRATYHSGLIHVQPVGPLESDARFVQDLSSEIALALLEIPAQYGCPPWLREAFAVYHSGRMADLRPPAAIHVRYLSDLNQEIQQYTDPPQRDDVDFLLGATMKFLIDRYGEEKAIGIFASFDGSSSMEEVLEGTFSQDFGAIERSWSEYMRSLEPRHGDPGR